MCAVVCVCGGGMCCSMCVFVGLSVCPMVENDVRSIVVMEDPVLGRVSSCSCSCVYRLGGVG